MPGVRRALLLTAVLLAAWQAFAVSAGADPPVVSTAPGRVVVALNGGTVTNVEPGDGDRAPAVALPDGGVVAALGGFSGLTGFDAVDLEPGGGLDPSFGTGGIARIAVNLPAFGQIEQIVRQPDGKLIVVGSGSAANPSEFAQLVLVRLDADGNLDQSFGDGGVDQLPIQASCGGCDVLALRPGGGFVVTGRTGNASPAAPGLPPAHWVVAGLTASGGLDPSFGQSGIATVPARDGYGLDVAELPDGDTVALGGGTTADGQVRQYLTRLIPSGALDASLQAAVPVLLPAGTGIAMVSDPDGSTVVEVNGGLARYTAAGGLDPSFGAGGVAPIGAGDVSQLLSAPNGTILVVRRADTLYDRDVVERIAADGSVDQTLGGPNGLVLGLAFGGGDSSYVFSATPKPIPPLAQNAFGGSVVERSDGSYLVLGGVSVLQPTAEAVDLSITDLGAAAFTSSFAPETSFGGPTTQLRAELAIPRERAATALARHGISVTIDVSAPGLARVVIAAKGPSIAESVLPVFTESPARIPVELTAYGERWLPRHPHATLTARLKARDMLTDTATAVASGRLR
jgi:uncharacterized delta-60 repeat protein